MNVLDQLTSLDITIEEESLQKVDKILNGAIINLGIVAAIIVVLSVILLKIIK